MNHKTPLNRNEYRCGMETNRNGKYTVRIHARFGRNGWVLKVYFLASSFERAMKKLEDSVQFLQRHEERLWFWAADRGEDPMVAGEMLKEIGLRLDRRAEFPRKSASLVVTANRPVPAFTLAAMRRSLADAVEVERAVAAGD